jgi:fructoselysine 6-phosphate deglycase
MKTALNEDIETALRGLGDRPIQHVFLVACGGSLSIMHPGKYFLDRHAANLTSDIYNGDEFVYRDPLKLDENALVILCSQTGTTRETVRAAKHARQCGARTIGMTLDPDSPLAHEVEFVLRYQASYTTGVPIEAANSNYAVLYMLLAAITRRAGDDDHVPALLESLGHLQPAIDKAHERYAEMFASFAPRFKDKPTIYTLASGPVYGAAYSFAICVLMEMQWIGSQAIHANEFFHGPFEVVDKDASFIAMIGLDETRPLAERARDFLFRFGARENMLVLDAANLDLTGIDDRFKGYLVPLIFFDALWRFAYKLAELRKQPMLEGRRYMKKISDY